MENVNKNCISYIKNNYKKIIKELEEQLLNTKYLTVVELTFNCEDKLPFFIRFELNKYNANNVFISYNNTTFSIPKKLLDLFFNKVFLQEDKYETITITNYPILLELELRKHFIIKNYENIVVLNSKDKVIKEINRIKKELESLKLI